MTTIELDDAQLARLRALLFNELHQVTEDVADKADGARQGEPIAGEDALSGVREAMAVAELLQLVGWSTRRDGELLVEDDQRRQHPTEVARRAIRAAAEAESNAVFADHLRRFAATFPLTDPEELESVWDHDRAAYEVVERLHDAGDALTTAIDRQVNAIGVQFSAMHEPMRTAYQEKGKPLPTPEDLQQARELVESAQAQWAAAVSAAEALLQVRQEGGE